MPEIYNYDFSDTANNAVNQAALDQEIEDAGPWSQPFDGTTVQPTLASIRVIFDAALKRAEVTTLDKVIANHQGIDTESFELIERELGAATDNTGTWQRRIAFGPTPALTRNWYRVHVFGMHRLDTVPVGINDRSEVRLMLDTGGGETNRAVDTWLSDKNHSFVLIHDVLAKHGDTISGGVDFRRQGAGMIARIERLVLTVQPLGIKP